MRVIRNLLFFMTSDQTTITK